MWVDVGVRLKLYSNKWLDKKSEHIHSADGIVEPNGWVAQTSARKESQQIIMCLMLHEIADGRGTWYWTATECFGTVKYALN